MDSQKKVVKQRPIVHKDHKEIAQKPARLSEENIKQALTDKVHSIIITSLAAARSDKQYYYY